MDASSPTPFDPAVLEQHVAFVRRLARGLVHTADETDELAARTIAAAWEQKPETGAGFRGWLERVTRRLSRRAVVADERRLRRERAAAGGEAMPPADELVAQIELQRRVARAFESLEEPYQSALFLRYFHDRTPTQIADELGVPRDTVKSRLQRGLAKLRERMDAAHEGRRDEWLAALVPWISMGGPIVATKAKVVPLAVAALVLAGASVAVFQPWNRDPEGREVPQRPEVARVDAAAAATSPPMDRAEAPGSTPERTAVAPDPSLLPFASGVVVDDAGAPIAGVDVVASRLDRRPINESIVQEPLRLHRFDRDRLATSDASGQFTVQETGQQLAALHFVHADFSVAEWSDLSADPARNQDRRIVLQPGSVLHGRVVDTSKNTIEGVLITMMPTREAATAVSKRVAAHLPDLPEYRPLPGWQEARTDAHGAFSFASMSPGLFRLSLLAGGHPFTQIQSSALGDPCEIVLTRSALLVDVTDADTHLPLRAGLVVMDAASGGVLQQVVPWTYADLDHSVVIVPGRLMLDTGFGQPFDSTPVWLQEAPDQRVEIKVRVVADGYVADVLDTTLSAAEEPPHLHVELTPVDGSAREAAISGRVGPAAAAAHATLSVFHLTPNWDVTYLEHAGPLLAVECDDQGEFRFFDLPKGRYRISARAPGFGPVWTDVEAPVGDVLIEMSPPASLEVVVHNRAGDPYPDAVVHVQPREGKHAWSARTNAQGLATLEGLPAASYRVGAFEDLRYDLGDDSLVHPQRPSTFPDDDLVELVAGGRKHVELGVVERVPVNFHFERDDGSPVTSLRLEFATFDGPVTAAYREWDQLRNFRFDIDSRGDAVASLYPGHYGLRVSEAAETRRIDFDVTNAADQRVRIRLPSLGPTGVLAGRLVELGTGKPIAQRKIFAFLELEDSKPAELGLQLTDDDGRFRFDLIPPGNVSLRIHADSFSDRERWLRPDPTSPYGFAEHRCTVESGRENTIEIAIPAIKATNPTLPTVELDVTITDARSGKPLDRATVSVDVQLDATRVTVVSALTDADGRLRTKIYAAESYRIDVYGPWESGESSEPGYVDQHLERTPENGLLTVDVALRKKQ